MRRPAGGESGCACWVCVLGAPAGCACRYLFGVSVVCLVGVSVSVGVCVGEVLLGGHLSRKAYYLVLNTYFLLLTTYFLLLTTYYKLLATYY